MALPINRTVANTAAEHVADHNTMHRLYNVLQVTPDTPPAVPNAKDDEFDGTSSVSWTQFGSPNTWNINSTLTGHAYLKASGSGGTLVGVVQAVPSFPFTATVKLKGTTRRANFHRGGGLCFFPAGAISGVSAPVYYGLVHNTNFEIDRVKYSDLSTFGSQTQQYSGPITPVYLRAIVNSATSVDLAFSQDGVGFVTHVAAYNPTFSIGQIGLANSEESALGGVESWFEWFRVV